MKKTGSGVYRYGFNGQEKSDETKGSGNSYTAEFWEYDPRIGRRWNLDPKPTVGISEYSAFGNSPIGFGDILGDTITPAKGVAKEVFQRLENVSSVDPYFKTMYKELKNSTDSQFE